MPLKIPLMSKNTKWKRWIFEAYHDFYFAQNSLMIFFQTYPINQQTTGRWYAWWSYHFSHFLIRFACLPDSTFTLHCFANFHQSNCFSAFFCSFQKISSLALLLRTGYIYLISVNMLQAYISLLLGLSVWCGFVAFRSISVLNCKSRWWCKFLFFHISGILG